MKIKWPEIIMKFGTHKILDRRVYKGFFFGGGGVCGGGGMGHFINSLCWWKGANLYI